MEAALSPPAPVPSPPVPVAETKLGSDDASGGRRDTEPAAQRRRTAAAAAAAAAPSAHRDREPDRGHLRIEIASPTADLPRSPSPFRVPRLPSPAPGPVPSRAAAASECGPPVVANLRVLADHLPTVALKIMEQLDAASLTAVGLASTRLNDLSEIAARRLVLRSKSGAGSRKRINPAFGKLSARSRWKRLAHCTEIVENFASLACVHCPISAEQVLAYLGCFRVPSLRCAVTETERMVSESCAPQAHGARGVARFMAGWLVPALFDFLSAHGRLFINCGHDGYSGRPTMKSEQIARVRADAACPEGFAFSGAGLGRRSHAGASGESTAEPPSRDALTLARLCVLKLFMPPWFGLEPLTTPRIRTPRSTPPFSTMGGESHPLGLPRHPGSVDGGQTSMWGGGRRKALPLPPASAEEKRLSANLLCGKCHPDEWLRAMAQAGMQTEASAARLALPVCCGPKVLLGRVFDCSCFVMSGADSPVVSFLATASDGAQVTVRDAWLAIWQNMPWVSMQHTDSTLACSLALACPPPTHTPPSTYPCCSSTRAGLDLTALSLPCCSATTST